MGTEQPDQPSEPPPPPSHGETPPPFEPDYEIVTASNAVGTPGVKKPSGGP